MGFGLGRASEAARGGAALLKIALVVLLGAIKWTCCGDLRGDRAAEFSAGVQGGFRFFCRGFLLWRMKENRGAVLLAEIRPLAGYLRRRMHLPKSVQQLLIVYLRGIVGHL